MVVDPNRPSSSSSSSSSPGIRWWPAILVLLVGAGFWLRANLGEALDHQQQFLRSAVILLATGFGLWLWLVLLSRLRGATRLKIFLFSLAVPLLVASMFRIRGVSGNLVPILEPRWASSEGYLEVSGEGAVEASADDFPQFLGPHRNATVRGVRLARDWSAQAPKELWRRSIGEAWSGFAVVGEAAVTMEQKGDQEVVSRYELTTGEPVWTHGITAAFDSVIGGNGPRATPTLHRGQVLAFGAQGDLRALDLATGELIWHRQAAEEHGAKVPDWGFASSPLIVEGDTGSELVVISVGQTSGASLVAYHAATGEPAWSGGSDRVGYSSPALVEVAGERQILIFNGQSVAAHSPADGTVLWTVDWPGDHPHVVQPQLVAEDHILVSSGYGHGSKLLRPVPPTTDDAQWGVEEIWDSRKLKAKFANFVIHQGRVYGLDDGIMVCLDPTTGERCWKRGRYGHGQILLVEDLLLVQTEKGELKLVEPNAEELRELGSLKALGSKSWNTLTLSGDKLLMRNADEVVCYEMPLAP